MKRKSWSFILLLVCFSFLCISAIHVNPDYPVPRHFPKTVYAFSENEMDARKILIGRSLFYDPLMSKDGMVSCASCHSPYNAFAHTDHALSHGIGDSIGNRNAPGLFNLAWQQHFMWDGAVDNLDMQAILPITNHMEMGESMKSVIGKINSNGLYKSAFSKAGINNITEKEILKALSQFMLTLISSESRYDSMKRNEIDFNSQEKRGYVLYKKNCSSCHQEPLFTNSDFKSNGLPEHPVLKDHGRELITQSSADAYLFKVPSLRNLAYTYPYMHDGRFNRLYDVINHYTSDFSGQKNISKELLKKIELNPDQKTDLLIFLNTLNDKKFVFDTAHAYYHLIP